MVNFELEQVEQDSFEPWLVVVDAGQGSAAELERAVGEWVKVLALTGEQAVLKHEALEDSDPWFGFAARVNGEVWGEGEVCAKLAPGAAATVEKFVNALISFNKQHTRVLEGGLYTHEEMETGSAAIEWLVTTDLKYLPLYLAYLHTLDLDHTVEQVSVVLRLSKVYSAQQLTPLIAWAAEHKAQLLNDWLAKERAWKGR